MIVSAAKAQEAAGVLEVELNGLTSDAVRGAYRTKAKDCHPDQHGTDKLEQWSRISWAHEALKHWLRHHPPEEQQEVEQQGAGDCRACAGTGRVKVGKSFGSKLTMQCVMCEGSGSLSKEKPSE